MLVLLLDTHLFYPDQEAQARDAAANPAQQLPGPDRLLEQVQRVGLLRLSQSSMCLWAARLARTACTAFPAMLVRNQGLPYGLPF